MKPPMEPKKFSPDRRVKQVLDALKCEYERSRIDEDLIRYNFVYQGNQFCCHLAKEACWMVLRYYFDVPAKDLGTMKQLRYDYGWAHELRVSCEVEGTGTDACIAVDIVADIPMTDDAQSFMNGLRQLLMDCIHCQQQITDAYGEKKGDVGKKYYMMQHPQHVRARRFLGKMQEMLKLAVVAMGSWLKEVPDTNGTYYQFKYKKESVEVELWHDGYFRVNLYGMLPIPPEDLMLARSLCGGAEAGFRMVKSRLMASSDEGYPVGCCTCFDLPMIYNADAFVHHFAAGVQDCINCRNKIMQAYQKAKSEQERDLSQAQQIIKKDAGNEANENKTGGERGQC